MREIFTQFDEVTGDGLEVHLDDAGRVLVCVILARRRRTTVVLTEPEAARRLATSLSAALGIETPTASERPLRVTTQGA